MLYRLMRFCEIKWNFTVRNILKKFVDNRQKYHFTTFEEHLFENLPVFAFYDYFKTLKIYIAAAQYFRR